VAKHLQKHSTTGHLLKNPSTGHLAKSCGPADPCDDATGCPSVNHCSHCDTDCTPECYTVSFSPTDAFCTQCCGNRRISGAFSPSYTVDQQAGQNCSWIYRDPSDTDLEIFTHTSPCVGSGTADGDQKLNVDFGYISSTIAALTVTKGNLPFSFPSILKTSEICAEVLTFTITPSVGCGPTTPCSLLKGPLVATVTPCCEGGI
jgi:hypothetical protein